MKKNELVDPSDDPQYQKLLDQISETFANG